MDTKRLHYELEKKILQEYNETQSRLAMNVRFIYWPLALAILSVTILDGRGIDLRTGIISGMFIFVPELIGIWLKKSKFFIKTLGENEKETLQKYVEKVIKEINYCKITVNNESKAYRLVEISDEEIILKTESGENVAVAIKDFFAKQKEHLIDGKTGHEIVFDGMYQVLLT